MNKTTLGSQASLPTVRLLTRRQAAQYCSVSVETFNMHCPVPPIALGPGKRLERFDVRQLDHWIETLSTPSATAKKDWLATLEEHDGSCSSKRS